MQSGKPSATAHLIAVSTVLLSQDARFSSIVPKEWASICGWFVQEYSGFGNTLLKLISQPWFRSAARFIEKLVFPGIMAHYVLRKHCLNDAVEEALKQGCEQVVVLGAGFDTLAYRLHHKNPNSGFFELDFPATQAVKMKALKVRENVQSNFHFISVDFTHENWIARLSGNVNFEKDKKTLFIIEGVLMYLTTNEVKHLFISIQNLMRSDFFVVFTFVTHVKNISKMTGWWVNLKREPFKWGIRPEALPNFLAPSGATSLKIYDANDFRRMYVPAVLQKSATLPDSEAVCIAEYVKRPVVMANTERKIETEA